MTVKIAPPAVPTTAKPAPMVSSTVVRNRLDWGLAPELAALLVRDDAHPFALIGRWAGGGALIGSAPVRIAMADEDPFELLDDQVVISGHAKASGAVGGGWFGWLGYGLGRRLEPVGPAAPPVSPDPPLSPDTPVTPDQPVSPDPPLSPDPPVSPDQPFRLAYYDHLLHLDSDGRWWFEALWTEERADDLKLRLRELESRAAHAPRPRPFSTTPWRATPRPAGHALAVEACRRRIFAGDLFQANICVRLESRLEGEGIDLFVAGVRRLRPDRAAFMSDPRGAVASLSPELFLERRGRRVRSAPIKGTRPRPADPVDAERQRAALLGSQKDHAENVMIVDLVRNDLGRVCVPGSVRVEALAEARAHAGVWHLVSEVRGLLRDGAGDADLVRAAFPPGSVTGAPKVAAMNVIAELESTPRELYTGAIGFASPLAGLELSVAIRTFEVHGKRVALGVGGGIVADSLPVAEAAECDVKAAPLLAAIGGTLDQSTRPPRVSPPPPRRLAPRPVSRPGPGHGVFETLLVLGGRPVDLERHLGRLRSSVQALYGTEPPLGLAEELLAAAWGLEQARLRVDVRPASRRLTAEIKSSPVKRREPPRLEPMTLPGGLGAHKWSDRRLLDALGAAADGEPLLCDLDGLVLESARANVFLVEDGSGIATPPADGRILPGVTRGRVIESARGLGLEVREEPFDLGRLARASEIFVTGAIGGVEPAALGSGPPRQGPVTRRLAQEWLASLQPGPKHR